MSRNSKWFKRHLNQAIHITDIRLDELSPSDCDCTVLKDFRQVASYSWSSNSRTAKPLIYVPGKPSVIINNLENLKSAQMSICFEKSIMDENRLHLPNHPMEPIFRSISLCDPNFEFSKVDFITDRNNLRKLLDFVWGKIDKSFIIDFQKVGNFILMVRTEEFSMVNNETYGKNFEEISTIYNKDYSSHRVITSYKFGDHNFVTRFEVDCVEKYEDEEISSGINKFSDFSKLCYINDGLFKPKTLIELTSRSNMKFPDKKLGQIFFSNTDYLVIGRHQDGYLTRIDTFNYEQIVERLNNKNNIEIVLSKLNDLLNRIKILVAEEKCVYSLVYDKEKDEMKFYKLVNRMDCLPKDLINKYSN